MLFKLSNLNYLNPALNNSALTKTRTLVFVTCSARMFCLFRFLFVSLELLFKYHTEHVFCALEAKFL